MKYATLFFCLCFSCFAEINYNAQIQPLLSRKCFSCHGKDKQKGKLRLDKKEFAREVLHAKKGSFLERINHTDPEEVMPPPEKGKLNDDEKKLLQQWIQEGSPYSRHWSFTSPGKITPPAINNKWIRNPVDQFILQSLNEKNFLPSPEAPKHTLLRRLSFSLTGLPPDKETKEQFLAGKMTYLQVVEKLLNSPHYGEHMAVFWLDGARYGDTNGIEYDSSRPIWPYRDWVVKAFNDNMPYDQFTIEQLAGDLIPEAKITQIIATGFNRCHITSNEQGSIEEEFRIRYAKDRLNTTASVFMGLTMSCAECHDHKYDPVSQKEYYQMLSFFDNVDEISVGQAFDRGDKPLVPLLSDQEESNYKKHKKDIVDLKKKMLGLKEGAFSKFWLWHFKQLNKPPPAAFLLAEMDAYFPLDEKTNTKTYNLITEHACNIKGILYRKDGKYNKALGFKASSFVDCLNVCGYEAEQKFSFGAWIYPEVNAEGTIVARFESGIKKGWKLAIKDKKIVVEIRYDLDSGIKVESAVALKENEWQHITATYNGTGKAAGVKIYLNSKELKTRTVHDNLKKGSIKYKGNMRIAAESYADGLKEATVDEVFVTPNLLNSEQIQQIADFNASSRFMLVPPSNLTEIEKEELFNYYLRNVNDKYSLLAKKEDDVKQQLDQIIKSSVTSMVMRDRPQMRDTYILERGNYQSPGEKVNRKTPAFLPPFEKGYPNNRLGLAQWLVNGKHPLTARVIVNRLWQQLFGQGLVRTPGDWGTQGLYPTHPELLDYLANYLVAHNWDMKKLLTHIITSATFRQSSVKSAKQRKLDPNNLYLSCYPRRRLPAEALRDQALFVSGLIVKKIGGKPVYPYQPEGLWQLTTSEVSNTRFFKQSVGKDNYRRSLYTFWKRNLPPPAMLLLDAPPRQICTLKRQDSNTPLQALVLMNDPQFVETYEIIGEKFQQMTGDNRDKIAKIYNTLLSRPPQNHEMSLCLGFLKKTGNNWRLLVHSLMNIDEFLSIE